MLSVRGYFSGDEQRRPLVTARVVIPRLAVSADIEFLVDTGADLTTIQWDDRSLLRDGNGYPLRADAAFPDEFPLSGISDERVRYGRDIAMLAFDTEQGPTMIARLPVGVALERRRGIPSLLGRDFLSGFRLDCNMPADTLTLERPQD